MCYEGREGYTRVSRAPLDHTRGAQGDEFTDTLADSKLLRCDRLETLRLVQCNITCNSVCRLAKAFEGVGESEREEAG